MLKVTLKKIEIVEIEVLQSELQNFLTLKNARLQFLNEAGNEYFNTLLAVDILQKLYYNFRGKIERTTTKNQSNLVLSVSEAVMLMQVCTDAGTIKDDYLKHVLQKFLNLIFNELVNIN